MRLYQICTNCVMDTTDSVITFDERGMCDHCHNYYTNIKPHWHPDERGNAELQQIVNRIKQERKHHDYDCMIGISGGVDSSYLLYYAKEILGLRPLAFSVDTGWNLNVAVENVEKIVRGLDIDLYTEIVNWEEMRDLQRAFFKANVPNQDIVQDHVIFAALYNYAAKNGINYVLTGSNYSTECVREPLEWVYLNDMRQIRDIHRRFGTMPLKTLPLCGMFKYRLYYTYIKGMKVVKPLDLIPYTKEEAMLTLEKRFGWQRYANKHFESVFTRFYEGYWLVKKFGFDKRRVHFSSLILTGQLTRDEALERLKHPPYDERIALEDMDYVAKKIGMTKEAFQLLMAEPNKSYKDYKSSAWLSMTAIKIARMLGMEGKQYR